ncbi:hypothetical protein ACHAXA_005637 [Cyclostephanos tholiformis]|jgi:hypothetical protein|uniref:Uncharacterized protein n=1 Tax=Cyclostephanos tholiformis TaxID=382380 RepID=A0ABD3RBM7_9STRA
MGSGSSTPANDDTLSSSDNREYAGVTTKNSSEELGASSAITKVKAKPPENESGYDRAQRVCRKKKRTYDACYTAQLSSKEEDCNELFEAYRSCFLKVIAKDMEKRGVKVNESSIIGEYKEETADSN